MAKPYPPETKAAVLSAMLAGMLASDAPAQFGVSAETARRWLKQYERNPQRVVDKKEKKAPDPVQDLMIANLRESLRTQQAILATTQDDDWIAQQDADKLAIFYGVIVDKSSRIVDSLLRIERSARANAEARD